MAKNHQHVGNFATSWSLAGVNGLTVFNNQI